MADHVHDAEGMARAIEAGVASTENGTLMDSQVVDLTVKREACLVPTVSAL